MENIREYLQGENPDYQAGVDLLRKHHKNRNLVNTLQRKETAGNVAKLRYELAKLAGDPAPATLPLPLVVEPAPAATPEAPSEPGLAELAVALAPEALAQVEELTRQLAETHNQKAALSNQLGDCESRAERYHVVQEIEQKQTQYNELAAQKQAIVTTGALPAAPQELSPEAHATELVKRRNNLRSNLSKARKSAEAAKTEAKRSEYEQKAGKLEVELTEVELRLKALAA